LHERLHDSHQPATRPHSSGCPAGHGGGHSGHAKAAYDRSRGFAPNIAARGIIKPTQSAQNRPLSAGGAGDSQWQGRRFQAAGPSSKQLKRGHPSWQCDATERSRANALQNRKGDAVCRSSWRNSLAGRLLGNGASVTRCGTTVMAVFVASWLRAVALGCAIIARLTLPPTGPLPKMLYRGCHGKA
jgi:hypothetical protein